MAVTKFVRAQDILKEKGFKAPPFDTAGFQNAVVEFFRRSDVSAKLYVLGIRFAEYEDAPKCGFSDCSQVSFCERYEWEEETRYYYNLTDYLHCRIGYLNTSSVLFPFIIVDEPYMTNAIALLKMAGFIVGRKYKWRDVPCYDVTLV